MSYLPLNSYSIDVYTNSDKIVAPTSVALRSSLCKIGNHLIELALLPKVDNDDKHAYDDDIYGDDKTISYKQC